MKKLIYGQLVVLFLNSDIFQEGQLAQPSLSQCSAVWYRTYLFRSSSVISEVYWEFYTQSKKNWEHRTDKATETEWLSFKALHIMSIIDWLFRHLIVWNETSMILTNSSNSSKLKKILKFWKLLKFQNFEFFQILSIFVGSWNFGFSDFWGLKIFGIVSVRCIWGKFDRLLRSLF